MGEFKFNDEIKRCLVCNNTPCKNGCPLENDIPKIIKLMGEKKYKEAYEVLSKTTVLPGIFSLICPHDNQCGKNCTLKFKGNSLDIGGIEFELAKMALENDWKISLIDESIKGKRVAVVGGGPSGITAAAFLARFGARVTIFEKREKLGGVMMYGIPDFRLDKSLLENVIDKIVRDLNIFVYCGQSYGYGLKQRELVRDYDAIFLATGGNVSKIANIPGKDLIGVYGGNELLENDSHPDYLNKSVLVSGGGNVAIDTARVIKRKGAKNVTIVYRRGEKEMPASLNEIKDAKSEGIEFIFNTNVIEVLGDEKVSGIKCVRTMYNKEHILVNDSGSEFEMSADYFVMSIGSGIDRKCLSDDIEVSERGKVFVDDNQKTSLEKVFAGGNLVRDNASASMAARSGRDAAYSIRKYLMNK